jgi:hypothetical protein
VGLAGFIREMAVLRSGNVFPAFRFDRRGRITFSIVDVDNKFEGSGRGRRFHKCLRWFITDQSVKVF